jgi:outer membrane protein OmpA-like peptidoglycan-associated protein
MTRTSDVIRCLALAALATATAGLGCGGSGASGGGCHYETWRGRCTLLNVRTAKTIERFPQSFVSIEALYQPESTPGQFAPPPFRKTLLAPADNELAALEHLRSFPSVDCSVDSPIGDPCAPSIQTAVPEFVPPAAEVGGGPVGCAKIEHSGGKTDVPSSVKLPGPFQFDDGSAAETPDARRLADDVARLLRDDPRVECVAVRGQSAPGEPFTLANERAQTVRRLLEARGIDHSRVTVFEASAPAHTASPDDQPVLSEYRRANLSVVVYGAAPAAP